MKASSTSTPFVVAMTGLAALAIAMGVGRFAFTPILPMMQEDAGVTVAEGGWLASANYLGYFVGALSTIRSELRSDLAIRIGLLAIAFATLAMGFERDFLRWTILRTVAGFASAWVLVYVSAWALARLAGLGRADLDGAVYAGVGVGIAATGVACLVLLQLGATSSQAWVVLGIAALLVTAVIWPQVAQRRVGTIDARVVRNVAPRDIPEFWRLVLCYGAFGLGYIIPATFLPLMAKREMSDPGLFGWAWPVFGAAAILSTLFASRLSRLMGQKGVWIVANLVMALGLLVTVVIPGLTGIMVAALCVGGTFMVITMAGLQEARRAAGMHARVLMAAMTSAFALGQIAGPLCVTGLAKYQHGFSYALAAAAMPLALASYALFTNRGYR